MKQFSRAIKLDDSLFYSGLARTGTGSFLWVDDTAFDFENWYEGEPNSNGSDGEDCVETYPWEAGKWNDAGCDQYKPLVCMSNKRKSYESGCHLKYPIHGLNIEKVHFEC